jgi:hypothetical protein
VEPLTSRGPNISPSYRQVKIRTSRRGLVRSGPDHKSLAPPLQLAPAAEKFGQRRSRDLRTRPAQRSECRQDGESLIKVDVTNLAAVATVPPECRAAKALGCLVSEQQAELEGFGQTNVVELGGRRERFRNVAPIECSAEAVVSRPLDGHERMFAQASPKAGRRNEAGAQSYIRPFGALAVCLAGRLSSESPSRRADWPSRDC